MKIKTTFFDANMILFMVALMAFLVSGLAHGQNTNGIGGGSSRSANAITLPQLSAGPAAQLFDDFYTVTNVGLLAIGAPTSDTCTEPTAVNLNHPGNLSVNSGTVINTGVYCVYTATSGAGQLFTVNDSLPWTWEVSAELPVLVTTTAAAYQMGLVHILANPIVSGEYFQMNSTNGVQNDWYCAYGSGPTLVDSTIAQVAGVYHRFTIQSDGTNIHWYIDGAQVCGTGVALGSITAGTHNVGTFTAVTATAATSVSLLVDYISFKRAITR